MNGSTNNMNKQDLHRELQECKECRFADWEVNQWSETKGYGKYGSYTYSENPTIMVVGQNPSNRRFPYPDNHSLSGHQGDFFREEFGKENLILSNLVQISTPDNKISEEDAQHGFFHLQKEIVFYKPKLIIALGRYCRDFIPNYVAEEVIYLKHPDYFMTYRQNELEFYKETIKDIRKNITWLN